MAEQDERDPTVVVERRSGGGIGLFVLGVAVGAGLALLFAPQSGAETRQDLRRGARRLRRKARHLAEDAREGAEVLVETGRRAAREMGGRAREAASEMRDSARDAAREARETIERRLARHGRADDDDAGDGGV